MSRELVYGGRRVVVRELLTLSDVPGRIHIFHRDGPHLVGTGLCQPPKVKRVLTAVIFMSTILVIVHICAALNDPHYCIAQAQD